MEVTVQNAPTTTNFATRANTGTWLKCSEKYYISLYQEYLIVIFSLPLNRTCILVDTFYKKAQLCYC